MYTHARSGYDALERGPIPVPPSERLRMKTIVEGPDDADEEVNKDRSSIYLQLWTNILQ